MGCSEYAKAQLQARFVKEMRPLFIEKYFKDTLCEMSRHFLRL